MAWVVEYGGLHCFRAWRVAFFSASGVFKQIGILRGRIAFVETCRGRVRFGNGKRRTYKHLHTRLGTYRRAASPFLRDADVNTSTD